MVYHMVVCHDWSPHTLHPATTFSALHYNMREPFHVYFICMHRYGGESHSDDMCMMGENKIYYYKVQIMFTKTLCNRLT